MKRWSVLSLAFVVVMMMGGLLGAQDAATGSQEKSMTPPPAGEMKHEMKAGMMGRGPKMGMPPISMVGTKDGGVILLVGKKLMKYDQDLNLVKEVDVKMPACEMMKKMEAASSEANTEAAPK